MAKISGSTIGLPETDPESISVHTASDHLRRGWAYYAKKDYAKSEIDFREALNPSPDDVDILYALGLSLKAQGKKQEAIQVFEKAINLAGMLDNSTRARMLVRLIKGHLNDILTGNWNLEKEIWHTA